MNYQITREEADSDYGKIVIIRIKTEENKYRAYTYSVGDNATKEVLEYEKEIIAFLLNEISK